MMKKIMNNLKTTESIVTIAMVLLTVALSMTFVEYKVHITFISTIIQGFIIYPLFYKGENVFKMVSMVLLKASASGMAIIISIEMGSLILPIEYGILFFLFNKVAFRTSGKEQGYWAIATLAFALISHSTSSWFYFFGI